MKKGNLDTGISLSDEKYCWRSISLDNAGTVQTLFKECESFNYLVEGLPVSPDASRDLFLDVPPGRSADEKLVYGLYDDVEILIGVLDVFPGYPEPEVWWIGLLLIDPSFRSMGLGRQTVEAFCDTVRRNSGKAVMLGVVEENEPGLKFWQATGFVTVRVTEPRTFGNKTQRVHVLRRNLT